MENRCIWCGEDPVYTAYHDTEWGVPEFDSRALFEKLVLDGFQAGLSWITILKKRENFRLAFDGFQPEIIANYTAQDVGCLLENAGIIRHRGKIEATVTNAQAWLKIEGRQGFDRFLWDYVDGKPLQNRFGTDAEIPAKTALSEQISRDLKKAGFKFCGPTIVYAFMQAVGMVNDHVTTCPRHKELAEAALLLPHQGL